MAKGNIAYLAFNRGLVSALGLARSDVKRLALSAERMVNWMVRVLGAMMLRVGMEHLGSSYANSAARHLKFEFATDDTAIIELTDSIMRVWVDDELVTRASVLTQTANGDFATDLSGWTDADEAGAVSQWVAPGYMELVGTGSAFAIRRQLVTNKSPGIEHALRIVVARGPVLLRVGTTSGGDEIISETELKTGTHSLAFTPTNDFYVELKQLLLRKVWVNECTVEAAGVMTLPTPWGADDISKVRFDQSADVLFVACAGVQQRRIERRATNSWSVVLYQSDDGPFQVENVGPITLTPSGLNGNITVTASSNLFRSSQVGSLFSITSVGQTVTKSMALLNDATSSIRVVGVGTDRAFTIVLSGFTGGGRTIVLQRSFDNAVWTAVSGKSWTADTTESYTDGLDNEIVYYRLILTVVGTAGTTTATLTIATGSIQGIVRITDYTSATSVGAEVLVDLGGTSATDVWAEGEWSDYRGWPTSVALVEGRLGWFGKNGSWISVSDAYDSFDATVEGDSGPISRTIGAGPVDTINWALALLRLVLGAQGAEHVCKSSSLDEPLSPTNFNIKKASTQGSAAVEAVTIDTSGVYVQRGGTRIFEISLDPSTYDYTSTQLSAMVPEIGQPGVVRMAVQRQPDTRLHCVRSDGTVAVLVFDKLENVAAWLEIETDGLIEDVVVLPSLEGTADDRVYYSVARTVNGQTVRYLEKWALESECQGGTLNKQLDSFVTYTGAATTTITGLSHLEGRTVSVWGDGADLGTATVASGQITVPGGVSVTNAVVGLTYTAQWKSGKPVIPAENSQTALNLVKGIRGLGLVMQNVHAKGVKYGPSFDYLQEMPGVEEGKPVGEDEIRASYDAPTFEFPLEWGTDKRLCLQAQAPKPCTILAAVCELEVHS